MRSTAFIAPLAGFLLAVGCASEPLPDPPDPDFPKPSQSSLRGVYTPPPLSPPATPPAPGTRADFDSKVHDRVYFAYDLYDLTEAAKTTLQAQAAWLIAYPNTRVEILGNADERGTREYNIALSLRRAETVKAFLRTLGVSPTRVTTVPRGESDPVDPAHNEGAWSRNRNARTVVVSE